MMCGWGRKGKGCQIQSLDLVQHLILIPSSYMFHAVMKELCTVRFAVGGVTVEMNFLCVFTQCAHGSVQIWWCQWAW